MKYQWEHEPCGAVIHLSHGVCMRIINHAVDDSSPEWELRIMNSQEEIDFQLWAKTEEEVRKEALRIFKKAHRLFSQAMQETLNALPDE